MVFVDNNSSQYCLYDLKLYVAVRIIHNEANVVNKMTHPGLSRVNCESMCDLFIDLTGLMIR